VIEPKGQRSLRRPDLPCHVLPEQSEVEASLSEVIA
jgi:hypothetical protein